CNVRYCITMWEGYRTAVVTTPLCNIVKNVTNFLIRCSTSDLRAGLEHDRPSHDALAPSLRIYRISPADCVSIGFRRLRGSNCEFVRERIAARCRFVPARFQPCHTWGIANL